MATAPSPSSTVPLQNPLNPKFRYLLPSSPLNLRFPHHLSPKFHHLLKSSSSFKPPQFSSQPPYDAVSYSQYDEEEEYEEPAAIGDCLVYEEGIFDDPFLQDSRNFSTTRDAQVSRRSSNLKNKDKDAEISPENLIPEKWLEVQKELNITKKERRKLSQQMEFGRKVEKKRLGLRTIADTEAYEKFKNEQYEKFKNEKLKQLNPLVLDKPEPKYLEEEDKGDAEEDDKSDDEQGEERRRRRRSGEEGIRGGRVAPRNPRLAVYGVGLEDISDVFNSESYVPGAASDESRGIF